MKNKTIYFTGKFEIISNKFVNFLQKIKKNNNIKVIFLFNESNIMTFEERKTLLEQHLHNLKYEIYEENNCAILTCKKVCSVTITKIKDSNFKNLKNVDAPLNYLKYILDKHYFIYDKIANMMSENRYKHTVSVALTAIDIAKNNQLDPKKAFIASMLHDIAKETSKDITQKIMLKSFKNHLNENEVVHHQFVGTIFAQKLFKIYNKDILRSIKYHTTGTKSMSKCAKIVYCSDKIEPTRGYDSQYMIDACKKDINDGFKLVLHENIQFLKNRGVKIGGLTQKAIKYYNINSF